MKRFLATAVFAAALNLVYVGLANAQEPILGEVRLFGFNWCPRGWAPANGQLIAITTNTALFSLYGTNFGGNGVNNFGLPDLRGRAPVGFGTPGQQFGAVYGSSSVTLTVAQLPAHRHELYASPAANSTNNPAGASLATFATQQVYASSTSPVTTPMNPNAIGLTGGNQPVSTQSPSLAMNWCVATSGIYPSRN